MWKPHDQQLRCSKSNFPKLNVIGRINMISFKDSHFSSIKHTCWPAILLFIVWRVILGYTDAMPYLRSPFVLWSIFYSICTNHFTSYSCGLLLFLEQPPPRLSKSSTVGSECFQRGSLQFVIFGQDSWGCSHQISGQPLIFSPLLHQHV